MPLAGVDDGHPGLPGGGQHLLERRDHPPEHGHVVAQGLPETPGLDEVPLHVDE
jgi:hypothetical protein